MAVIVPPGYGIASHVFTGPLGTEPYVTTLGLDLSDAGGDFVAAADQAMACFTVNMKQLLNNELRLDRVSLLVGQDGGSGSVDSTADPVAGTRSVAMAPTAMSIIARKNTPFLGRRGRGRMFLPGMCAEADVSESGAVDQASVVVFNAALQNFFEDLVSGDTLGPPLQPVLLHSPGGPVIPTPLSGFTTAPLVGWVRGRIR